MSELHNVLTLKDVLKLNALLDMRNDIEMSRAEQ